MEPTLETETTLVNPLPYKLYSALIDTLVASGQTSGPEQTEEKIAFTKLNSQRSKRVHKTFALLPALETAFAKIPGNWNWFLLSESWCGDGAQLVPAIAEIADRAPQIELSVLMRDENPALMDQYLTNGGRAIPKLICQDAQTGETLFTWGPRPAEIQNKVLAYKAENPEATKEDLHLQLAIWYAKDKSEALQRDLLQSINKVVANVSALV